MLKFVVGLFESKGIAEDAINRLRHEGVPEGNIFPMLIRETAPLPAAVSPAIDALSVDPLVVGNVRETFAPLISSPSQGRSGRCSSASHAPGPRRAGRSARAG